MQNPTFLQAGYLEAADAPTPSPSAHYTFFDHDDKHIEVLAWGETPERAMEAAAQALFALQTDVDGVGAEQRVLFEFMETDVEMALFRWLNLLLAHAQVRNMQFGEFRLRADGNRWYGEASGQANHDGLARYQHIRGLSLEMLQLRPEGERWRACYMAQRQTER